MFFLFINSVGFVTLSFLCTRPCSTCPVSFQWCLSLPCSLQLTRPTMRLVSPHCTSFSSPTSRCRAVVYSNHTTFISAPVRLHPSVACLQQSIREANSIMPWRNQYYTHSHPRPLIFILVLIRLSLRQCDTLLLLFLLSHILPLSIA